ncbi:hypothetical protein EYC80_001325 [Monilinia laxa]|uniref:Uncharacterized protein n=1 Tax=Monilinia laxa TaxID=61186 RepID=A0A5N6K8Y6_MONLA|nr:hypothetical protein EYC80_001325 [Monilinia laxa]
MTHPSTQSWCPSTNDIQPNPNTPFPKPPAQDVDIPLTPLQEYYNEVRAKLAYTAKAKEKIQNRGLELFTKLDVARIILGEHGDKWRDGRERARRVVVLEKLVVVHDQYFDILSKCEEELREKQEALEKTLKSRGLIVDHGASNEKPQEVRAWRLDPAVVEPVAENTG